MSDITDGLDYEEGSGDREVSLSPVEVGPTGKGAASFGYGRYGMREVHEDLTLGGRDPFELEMDALQSDFRDSYRDTRHIVARMRGPELVRLLMDLDPDYAAERFAPEADDDVADTYDCWALGLGGPEEET